jgi:hypothetical protein
VGGKLLRIGEVSERTGLFVRTIRHHENVGVVAPSECGHGGSRLDSEAEVRRLAPVRRCGRSLSVLTPDRLPVTGGPLPESDERAYEELVTRLRKYWVRADGRCVDLRRELGAAEEFARSPHGQPARLFDAPATSKAVRR